MRMANNNSNKFFLLFIIIIIFQTGNNNFIVQAYDDMTIPTINTETSETSVINTSREINEHTVVVSTYDELVIALTEDNGYDTIYLGADIAATTIDGIAIHSSKTEVVIDGHPPDAPEDTNYTFSQYDTTNITSVIYIDDTNFTTKNITLRNIIVKGANLEGIVFIPETSIGVTILYQNMVYEGPQAATNRNGTVHFNNCSFTMKPSNSSAIEALVEANQIEMSGTISIDSPDLSFLFYFTHKDTRLSVMKNADITINTEGSFIHTESGADIPNIYIYSDATFNILCKSGFTRLGENIRNMFIDENASVFITQNSPLTNACLRIEQVFEMQPGSTLVLFRLGAPGIALYFPVVGGKAIFNNPKRVVLFSPEDASIYFFEEGYLNISTSGINVWQGTSPEFGEPTFIWNNSNDESFSLTNQYFDAIPQEISHTLDEKAPITAPLNKTTFDLTKMTLLTFGNLDLTIQPLYSLSNSIRGKTDPDTQVTINYETIDGLHSERVGTADANGYFTIPIDPTQLDPQTIISVTATIGMLSIYRIVKIINIPNEQLSFTSLPKHISFDGISLPSSPTLFPRNEPNFSFSIFDSRDSRDPWRIDINLLAPLTATLPEAIHELHDALVFVDENGFMTPLTTEPLTIYSELTPSFGEFETTWGATEGILLHIVPGTAYANLPYTTTIQWSLIDAP